MTKRQKGINLVLATATISGFAIFINKFSIAGNDPYFYTFLKNIMAGGFLVGIVFITKNWQTVLKLKKLDVLKLMLIGLIGGAIPFLLFFKGLSITSALSAGFIHKTMFIFVGVLAAIILKEKITKSLLFGIVSLMVGSILFMQFRPQALSIGDLYIFLAVLMWAMEIIISKQALRNLSGTVVAGARLLIGSLFILIFLSLSGRVELFTSINTGVVTWIFISGSILAGYNLTFYNGLKQIKASTATAILTLGMPVTGLLTVVFLDKSFKAEELIGLAIILLGIILVIDIKTIFPLKIINKIWLKKEIDGRL